MFSGTGYESRIEFFQPDAAAGPAGRRWRANWIQLKPRSRLRKYLIHDPDDCLDNEQTVALYQDAHAGINMYRREAEQDGSAAGWAMGPREVEMAAAGLFYLRDPRPEGDAAAADAAHVRAARRMRGKSSGGGLITTRCGKTQPGRHALPSLAVHLHPTRRCCCGFLTGNP